MYDHADYYARFAQAAYQPDFTGIPKGYIRDAKLSDDEVHVFHNPHISNTVISFRGTEVSKATSTAIKDVVTDIGAALGYQDVLPRFQKAEHVARLAHQKYGEVTFVGHSLGGTLARHVHNKNPGTHAVTFSEFAYPLDEPLLDYFKTDLKAGAIKIRNELAYKATQKIARHIAGSRHSRGLVAYTHHRDPVAFTTNLVKDTILVSKPKLKNPHSLQHFIK